MRADAVGMRGKTMAKKTVEKVLSYEDRMKWFTQARFGMFIHWGVYAIPARGEWVRSTEKIADENYRPYFEEFNPYRYDPRTWAKIAKAAGQQYVVMTAKHHDGFCLFDSKLTDWKATKTPAGRDLVKEYVEAFRAEGLKVGFYYSLLDWNHPHYPVDQYHPLHHRHSLCRARRHRAGDPRDPSLPYDRGREQERAGEGIDDELRKARHPLVRLQLRRTERRCVAGEGTGENGAIALAERDPGQSFDGRAP